MSAAFRNFVFTLVIMLCVFGYIAYKALPDIENAVFSEESTVSEASEEESAVSEEVSEDVSEVSNVTKEDYRYVSCLFALKNSEGDVCSLIYAGISEATQAYVTCRIPVDIYVDNGAGVSKPISAILGDNNGEYISNKIAPLIGHDIDYYFVCTEETLKTMIDICAAAESSLVVDLTYPIRYLDPAFAGLGDKDEYYVNIQAGKVKLTKENIRFILDSTRNDGEMSYAFQESMGLSLFRQFVSVSAFKGDVNVLNKLFGVVKTNIPLSELLKNGDLLFTYPESNNIHITYPTSLNKNYKVPNWPNGIKQIRQAEQTE